MRARLYRSICSTLVFVMVLVGVPLVTAGPAIAAVDPVCAPTTLPVAGGGNHSLAVVADGTVKSVGSNWAGQLGDGTSTSRTTAVAVSGLGDVVAVAGGVDHSAALTVDGQVWTWGWNGDGRLGDGTTTARATPVAVNGLPQIRQVAAGYAHTMALSTDGTVWAWGDNTDGQLGDGTNTDRLVPVQVAGLSDVVAIEAGSWHSLAVRSDGSVWSWGDNSFGQLGNNSSLDRNSPVQVSSLGSVTAVAAGGEHSLALRSNGTVWAWGRNNNGQLGDGTTTQRHTPVQTSSISTATQVAGSVAGQFSMALLSDGTVRTWGAGNQGQLGNGTTGFNNFSATPVQVSGLSAVKTISAGAAHGVALRSNGAVWGWGKNSSGQLGDGTTTQRTTPVQMSGVAHALPGKPANLEAVAGEQLAYLTWDAPDGVITQYAITAYVDGVAVKEVAAEPLATSQAVTGLTEGSTYAFKIAAQNCLGNGAGSDQSNLVVPTGVQLNMEGFSVEGTRVNDRMGLQVNTFNGNTRLDATDLHIAGTAGMDLTVARAYNSRTTASSVLGPGWSTSVATDVKLTFLASGSVSFHGPGGFQAGFARKTDGTFQTPAGIDADLVENTDGSYTLTEHASGARLEFDSAGRLTAAADRNANTITYSYHATSGGLASITDTQSRTLTLTYRADGLLARIDGPTGRQLQYGYTSGRLTSYTDPAGGITSYGYDSNGRLNKITTPEGRIVELGYDTNGRITSLSWPLAAGAPTTTFAYSDHQTVVTDPRGKPTTYHYDPVGRTIQIIDANGNDAGLEYTSDSNVRAHRAPRGGVTAMGYDTATNLTSVSAPTGARQDLTYGDASHPHLPTVATDPQGNRLTFTYDTKGNLTTQTDQLSSQNQVRLTYNTDGTLATSRDPRGNTTSYSYDAAGNLTGMTPPAPLGATGMTRDGLSRIATLTDGNGNTTTYSYDVMDRVTGIVYDDGTTIAYVYDGDGNLTQQTEPSGTTTMTYGPRNELTGRTTPDGATVTYSYDKTGNLTGITDSGGTVAYTYNDVNLPTRVRHPDSTAIDLGYDVNYNRTAVDYPNGVTLTSTYDDSDRLVTIAAVRAGTTLRSYTYSYTKPSSGNPDTVLRYRMTDHDGNVTSYTYDVLNRLTQSRTVDPSGALIVEHSYTYDGAGNRLTHRTFDGTLTVRDDYTYNAANQLIEVNGETITYDANGNMTSSSLGAQFDYNTADQTTHIQPRPDRGLPASFSYRGPGQTERTSGGALSQNVSTGGDTCLPGLGCFEDPDTAVSTAHYTHNTLGVASQTITDTADTTYYTRDTAGRIVSAREPTGPLYYLTDGLGSVVAVTDTTGQIVASYTYGPFGETQQADGPLAATNPWRYAGAYLDPTGLYKMGQRYYDPELGRWTQQDPLIALLDPLNWNRYAYAGNNPINYVDRAGTCTERVRDTLLSVAAWTGITLVAFALLPPIAFASPWLFATHVALASGGALAGGLAVSSIRMGHSAYVAGDALHRDCVRR